MLACVLLMVYGVTNGVWCMHGTLPQPWTVGAAGFGPGRQLLMRTLRTPVVDEGVA